MNAKQGKPGKRTFGEFLKDALLFLATPFITIIYLMMFPFIGLTLLVKAVSEERSKRASRQ
jgi:hypothetical protein